MKMRSLNKLIAAVALVIAAPFGSQAQVCIPTFGTVCFTGGGAITEDLIDNFWTVGGVTDITNMDTDCCLLPNNYWYTGLEVHGCAGETIETNVQCEIDAFDQGFAIWIDWNTDDIFDLAEKVYASPGFGDVVYTGSFTIPLDATPGSYNMRVRSKYASGGAAINPCDFQTYGETEDYIVVVGTCDPTICEGDTVELDLGTMPPGPITYSWTPDIAIADATAGPTVEVWPDDTTYYVCEITSPDSTWLVPIDVYVIHPANPFAGLDDTVCHDIGTPYLFPATVDIDETELIIDWEMDEFYGGGTPLIAYSPDDDELLSGVVVSLLGTYDFVLYTEDVNNVCPDQSDTITLTFTVSSHELEAESPQCFGVFDGTITVTGTGMLPTVEYSIDGGATWQPSNVFTDLPAGIYTVISRDASGCEFSSDIELFDPEEVGITVSADTLICQNGTATVTAAGTGGVSYSYVWSIPGADDAGTQDVSPEDSPYIVTVTVINENDCPSVEETIEITLRDPITLDISVNDSICPSFGSGASVIAAGGDGAFTYTWTENGAAMPDITPGITTTPDVNTVYCVTVDDGCETTPVTICTQTIIHPVPVPIFTSDITAGCNPSTALFEATVVPSDIPVWTINGSTFTDLDDVSYEFNEVGFYDITLEITNEWGCVNEITASDYFEIVDVPHFDFYINPNPTTIFNTTIKLTPSDLSSGHTYDWSMPEGTPATSTDETPTVFYPEGVPNDYEVTLTVTNEYGCFNTKVHTVNVLTDVIIYAPNAFTPDGDQYNEGWSVWIDGIDIYDFNCQIYNRWGEIVWESFDASATWNGTYSSDIAPEGAYVWVVQAKEGTTDKRIEFRGTVTLLR